MEFISTFELHGNNLDLDSSIADRMNYTQFTRVLSFEDFPPNSDARQALVFIGRYAAFSLLRKLSKTSDLCPNVIPY